MLLPAVGSPNKDAEVLGVTDWAANRPKPDRAEAVVVGAAAAAAGVPPNAKPLVVADGCGWTVPTRVELAAVVAGRPNEAAKPSGAPAAAAPPPPLAGKPAKPALRPLPVAGVPNIGAAAADGAGAG